MTDAEARNHDDVESGLTSITRTGLSPFGGDPALRVVVAARQTVVRVGWQELLGGQNDLLIVGGIRLDDPEGVRRLHADVALVATDGANLDEALHLSGQLAELGMPVVLVGSLLSLSGLSALFGVGARGLLTDDASADDVAVALQAAARGLLVLSPPLIRAIPSPLRAPRDTEPDGLPIDETLTEREQEVLGLLALGLANKAIARRLDISEHTVKFHVGSILAKLGAESRTEAVTRAARRGILAL